MAIVSVPEFLVATLAVLIFAVHLRWLPALSYVSDIESLGQLLRAFAMPVLTLTCVVGAQMMRMTRAAVIDQLEAPYIEMVRLKGASPLRMPWWDGRADAAALDFPDVTVDKQHIDILSARFVLQPGRFDVVVASNLFGDILSDLGPATAGTIGLAPSANLNPERRYPSLFEPVHGSAPDIYGRNIANPIAMIWSGALMLDFLTQSQGAGRAAHDAILRAIETVLAQGPRTADLGGNASTTDLGKAITALVAAA